MSQNPIDWNAERARVIGLGETSARKSYFSELQLRVEELRASEKDLRTVFDSTHDAIFIHDFEGRVRDVNEAVLRLYRLSREEALGYSIQDYSAVEQAAGPIENILARLRQDDGDTVFGWMALRPKDRSTFPVEVSLRTALWCGERMVVAVVRDITERRQAEEQQKRLEEQVLQLRKMESIGQLAGGIAHDFNNMLTPIMNYAMMLRDDLPADNPMRPDLEEIVQSALRARDLTRQLLAFARQQKLTLRQLSLNQLITNLERMLRRTLRENVAIGLDLDPGLPAVEGDAGQVEQILINLAINGQDAMPDGGTLRIRTLHATLEARRGQLAPGDYACIEVSDTGHGMDRQTLERIFEPFFTTKGLGRGTGLGLSTVYGIVRQHGAHIEVESKPGEGSLFRIHMPSVSATPLEGANALGGQGARRQMSGLVLLVEDQQKVRQSTRAVLERHGYSVLEAENGAEALHLARTCGQSLKLLVSDVIMDGIGGLELKGAIEELHPKIGTLFISGYPAEVISRKGVLEKGIGFLPKPFTPDELVAACDAALRPGQVLQ